RYVFGARFGKDPLISSPLTDQEGRFRIQVPAGTQGELQPRHPDWTARRIPWKKGQGDVGRIPLSPAGRIQGQVVDARTGKPLAECHVGYYGSARPRSGAACMMHRTDAQGRFQFYVPAGVSYLYIGEGNRMVQADSHRTVEVRADRDPEPVVLKAGPIRQDAGVTICLTPEQEKKQREDTSYRLQGVFRTADGRPVTKVDLRLVYQGRRHTAQSWGRSGEQFEGRLTEGDEGREAFFL